MEKKLALSDREFNFFKKTIYDHIGVNLTDAKRPLVISRLSKRLKILEIGSFSDYCKYLQNNPGEIEDFANILTTNVTKFFREKYHFDFLSDTVLPRIVKMEEKNMHPPRVKGWSAGCSTGEEPYSIAIALDDFFKKHKKWDYRVLASDINTQVLQEAKEGVYVQEKAEDVSKALFKNYFTLGVENSDGLFRVKDAIKKKVNFAKINLAKPQEYPRSDDMDFIFCRNVFIYFDQEGQRKVLKNFYQRLRKGGYLFLGHSETIRGYKEEGIWEQVYHTVYRKK